MSPRTRLPLGTLLAVVVLAVVALIGGTDAKPATRTASTTEVPVQGATAVCPDLRQVKGGLDSRVSVGAVTPLDGTSTFTGSIRQHANATPTAITDVPVTAPGQVAVGLGTNLKDDALVLDATGSFSAGLETEQVTRGERGRERGLAGLRCEPPQTEAWFVGGNTSLIDLTTLVLVNVDDTPSTVDVSVFTSVGPTDPRAGSGITINPHSRVVLNVDTLAPDRRLLAVHVHSRRGRVAAGLRVSRLAGKQSLGVDWVPQSTPPSTSVLVPGIPLLTGGARGLQVSNPGADDTTVSVQVMTADGEFVPTGLDALPVPAGSSVSVDLGALARQSALAARITSSGGPIVAGGSAGDFDKGFAAREFAYTAGSLPLSGPALLTDLVINRPTESTLILTAPDSAASVTVRLVRVLGTTQGLPGPKTVRIPAGRTVTLALSTFYRSGADVKLAVEVKPDGGSGPVYAARYLAEHGAHGPLTTLLDLQGPATAVSRPPVELDPRIAD